MNALVYECTATHSDHKFESFRFQYDRVIQLNSRKHLIGALLTSVFCISVGCSIDRNPIPLDSVYSSEGHDESAAQQSADDSRLPSRESPREGGAIPSRDAESRDSSAPPREASARETSTRDTSTLDASTTDASVDDEPTKPDTALAPVDVEEPIECDLPGIYGGQVTVEAWWGGRTTLGGLVALVDAGRAMLLLNIMYFIESIESDGTIVVTAKTCNIELPPFYTSIVCESYQPVFPVEVWDGAVNPLFTVTGNAECTGPGCTLHFDTLPALLGVSLEDPFGDWPEATETRSITCEDGTGRDCFPDHDDDNYPGITVDLLTEGNPPSSAGCYRIFGVAPTDFQYRAAPLSTNADIIADLPIPRTDRIRLGTRAMIGGDAVIANDCSRADGEAVAEGFQSRAINCVIQQGLPTGADDGSQAGANTRCTSDQRQFMDENLPLYNCMKRGDIPPAELIAITDRSPSAGPKISLVRLGEIGDDITCEDVRNAAY